MLKPWDELPDYMKNEKVKVYYNKLQSKRSALAIKKTADFLLALMMTVILMPVILILAVWIKLDSKGPVFYRQERITTYGKTYRIFKFRTMVTDADQKGPAVTCAGDDRVTGVGNKLRKLRLDEIPQLFNVLAGDMSFVGIRPEVREYVDQYSDEMYATLLLPAGITSETSIYFKDEDKIIDRYQMESDMSVDEIYIKKILPVKMRYNLMYISSFNFWKDIAVMIKTVLAVIR